MSVHAFIAYLRVEAQQEEERARVLRALAATIESGSTKDSKWWEQQTEGLEILSYRLIHFVSSTFFLILLLSPRQKGCRRKAQNYNQGETAQAHGLHSLYTGELRGITGRKSYHGSQGYYFHRSTPLGANDRRRKAGEVHLK